AAQAVLVGVAVAVTFLEWLLPGWTRAPDPITENSSLRFGGLVLAATAVALLLVRRGRRVLGALALLVPLGWLVWTHLPWYGGEYPDLWEDLGTAQNALQWQAVAEGMRLGAWAATFGAVFLSAACAVAFLRSGRRDSDVVA
ncbi:hypothetical protein ACFQ07_09985, partial [Actinomadura adrarensis]